MTDSKEWDWQDETLCDGCQNACSECEHLTEEFKDFILKGGKHSEFKGRRWK